MPTALTEQFRLRLTESEKAHLEEGQRDAGYKSLSEFVREQLFSRNVIAAGSSGLVLIPAYSADESQRFAAQTAAEELLRLLQAQRASEEASQVERPAEAGSADPGSGAGVSPPAETPAPDFPPPAEDLPAVTAEELEPLAPPVGGPQPGELETAFLDRRVAELQSQGRTAVVAGFEAEAEWRNALEAAAAAPEQSAAPAPAPEEPLRFPGERPRPDLGTATPDTELDPIFADLGPGVGSCASCGATKAGPGPCMQCGN